MKSRVESYTKLEEAKEDLETYLELIGEDESVELIDDFEKNLNKTLTELEHFKLSTLLKGEYDSNDAIIAIHPGAGGLEAQDWAEMLLRMYTRWAENSDYTVKILDLLKDTEGGIKSVTFEIQGNDAYGYLKGEKGVHRLVRISPFDSQKRRHTSFASVDVTPVISEDEKIEINPKDLTIDTYRSTGAGGQHVNTTDSAVRITHIPTGIVVSCQNERSQLMNKQVAMKILISKLVQLKEEERKEKIEDLQGNYNEIGWGHQIRSYVFQPYSLVKDHITNHEAGDVYGVMDGDLDGFINAYLSFNAKENKE